jgi:hypothetical protein
MAATQISSIITQVRAALIETTARFWTDAELLAIMNLGVVDLWGAILDLHQDHYFRVNTSDVVLRANATEISGIPEDCFRVTLIEPRDTTVTASGHQVLFVPRKYNHPDFIIARTLDAQDPGSLPARQLYYAIVGEGSPTGAPQILTAPVLSADLNIRLVYNPTASVSNVNDINPIPGGSDNALKNWTLAYAKPKDQGGSVTPDAGALGVYATEKAMLLTRLTPREEQEPEIVEDMFQGYGSMW